MTRCEASGAYLRQAIFYEANLTGASLNRAELVEADLSHAQLPLADLEGAVLTRSRLGGADLNQANLSHACLKEADLSRADLTGARLVEADLAGANFGGAKLIHVELSRALLIDCNLSQATLSDCRLDDVILRGIRDEGLMTSNLSLTPATEAAVLVDDLAMVALMEVLLAQSRWRELISPNALRVVLLLGRFPDWRRPHLDAIRSALRRRRYAPIAIDLEKPIGVRLRGFIQNLAHLSRFIVADLAGSREFMKQIQQFSFAIEDLPFQAIMPEGKDLGEFPGLAELHPYRYRDTEHLIETFGKSVLGPLEQRLEVVP